MTNSLIIHWAGGVQWKERGMLCTRADGWPACVSGDRARKIANDGTQSFSRESVTCGHCLRLIAKVERLRGEVGTGRWAVKR